MKSLSDLLREPVQVATTNNVVADVKVCVFIVAAVLTAFIFMKVKRTYQNTIMTSIFVSGIIYNFSSNLKQSALCGLITFIAVQYVSPILSNLLGKNNDDDDEVVEIVSDGLESTGNQNEKRVRFSDQDEHFTENVPMEKPNQHEQELRKQQEQDHYAFIMAEQQKNRQQMELQKRQFAQAKQEEEQKNLQHQQMQPTQNMNNAGQQQQMNPPQMQGQQLNNQQQPMQPDQVQQQIQNGQFPSDQDKSGIKGYSNDSGTFGVSLEEAFAAPNNPGSAN
jgi:hypothetical protein